MAEMTSVSKLAKLPKMNTPVITLNLNLKKLNYDTDEQTRVKTVLKKIQNEIGNGIDSFINEVNDLIRQQLPYEGITLISDKSGKQVYYLIRTSVEEADYHIDDFVDYLLLLSEAPNADYTLLELNRDNSKVYQLKNKRVSPLAVEHYPATVQDALGTEIRGGELNFSARGGNAQYHGHNETSQEKQIDQERYYRVISDLLKDDKDLGNHDFILMGLTKNVNLFKKLSKGLKISDVMIDQSVQNLSATAIAELVNNKVEEYNKAHSNDAVMNKFKDQLYTDPTNIQNLLNSRQIRQLFVASRDEINQSDPEMYAQINQLIKQALAQDADVTVVSEQSEMPLVSGVS
ncbi:MAG: hypothetical protein LKF37_10335 [Lentilactobacillus diolivorans]|jgi:hypothetical protein|uniref:Bacterial archaeo-eukaryotic release factor family 6 domain-containing protein n=2 Tax=Lentilactobacillus diolivorans TaxID=179838 RepID=A0A0R1S951_9LACO|nr:hypothetical protein [Lentilactobacillus diolivorans]RRG04336.1 MAG: hypothetical protein DUD34_00185 [Lactobacillus sp.]KRL63202.1 hypothetical protein FC85_GL001626 [Lentilactobacillus diolivorans DSM 14421]MCH4165158.1 hypothetical protein [Lentilactobacillus diolivorans]MDH5106667.1 hypothetical protein [Lentilactobacillus diolivorans]GEP24452.1 hypothetical protein LDI01_20450 [Lentilactobacillus diolivorans]